MRKPIRHFVRICTEHLPVRSPVYEFGALQVTGAAEEDLRVFFQGCEYIGADMRPGPGVDLQLDLHDIELPDGVAGTVLCLETLEHVEHPRRALREIHRILRPGGVAIISTVFNFPVHAFPNDYWRFTPEGLRSLLQEFSYSHVAHDGKSEANPKSVVGIGIKDDAPDTRSFVETMEKWSKWYSTLASSLHRNQ